MGSITPQYKNDYHPASSKASLTGKGNKRSGTRPEKLLINALRNLGIRAHPSKRFLPGNPDIVFWKHRLVVFCDGDFWHGKNWRERRKKLEEGFNPIYWVKKIEYNRKRDRMNNRILKNQGWRVIRIWEHDIKEDPHRSILRILSALSRSNR